MTRLPYDVRIVGYLYMINQPALFDMCGFCGLVLVVGDSDRGMFLSRPKTC